MKSIAIETLKGKQLVSHLSELAKLRLTVFREYPYLYEGNLDFERHYLSLFANSEDAFLAIAKEGNKVIAAISGFPLDCAQKEIRNAFTHYPMSTKEIFALCEIVVLKEYRSQKIGTLLYREFENQLSSSRYKKIVLWQVIKSQNDPKKTRRLFFSRSLLGKTRLRQISQPPLQPFLEGNRGHSKNFKTLRVFRERSICLTTRENCFLMTSKI